MGGQEVDLQRRYNGTWHTVVTGRTGRLGHVWFNLSNRHRGLYRMRTPGSDLHTSDASGSFVVR
jgi:hypothetical protein